MILGKNKRFALYASAALAALSVPVQAQEITSSIRGTLVDENGTALSGVTITATHVPSGSRSTTTTNAQGAFASRNLRPGGPYTIEIQGSSQYQGQRLEDVFLQVNDTLPLNLTLTPYSSVEEISITASRYAPISTGAGSSTYGSGRISELPSIGRDFKDSIRLNPFVDLDGENSAISIAGSNNRFNNITLDGISQSDTFGLNANGVPTQRTPISIDALEQVGVAVAPFDVEFGRFTGGQVNLVTKSGTNEFHGSAFYQYRDESLAGDQNEEDEIDLGDFKEEFYGGTVGGPIIKDKLFFFASYEKFEATTPSDFPVNGNSITGFDSSVNVADLQRISEIANRVYGFDPLTFDIRGLDESDEKYFFKVDWNINDNHRAFVSYQRTEGNQLIPQNTDPGRDSFAFLSNYYNRAEELDAFNFQLFSDWTDQLSTEVKVGYSERTTSQVSLSEPGVGEIEINTAAGGNIFLGTDDARHANQLENELFQLKLKADYLIGDHQLTAGFEFDQLDVFNLFLQDSLGSYIFDSIDDFEARRAAEFEFAGAASGDVNDAAAQFTQDIFTYYLQDRWDVSDKVTLTGGVRIDYYSSDDLPNFNQSFFNRNGFTNTARLNNKTLVQPRLAFTYQHDDRTQFSGGAGIFGGGDPTVWIANSFSNDGVTALSFDTERGDAGAEAILDNVDIRNIPQAAIDGLSLDSSNVNAVDPDFDVPSVWRFNLKVDRYQDLGFLGDDWHFALEGIWTRTQDAANWIELRRSFTGVRAVDGSPIVTSPGGHDLLLTNTEEGTQTSYAFSFDKSWDSGLSIFGSYTHTDSESVIDATSSTARSNFNFPAFERDRNNRQVGTSPFEIRHNVKLGATYAKDFWEDNTTTISLFYNGRSGRPYSLTFDINRNNNGFGAGNSGVDFGDGHLVFIPRADQVAVEGTSGASGARVLFSDQATLDAFNQFVENFGLERFRGETVPKQSQRSPWVDELDLRISQEVGVGFGKVELWMDLENVLNFIDSDSGRIEESQFSTQALIDLDVLDDGRFRYTGITTEPNLTLRREQSVWRVQFGVKYKF